VPHANLIGRSTGPARLFVGLLLYRLLTRKQKAQKRSNNLCASFQRPVVMIRIIGLQLRKSRLTAAKYVGGIFARRDRAGHAGVFLFAFICLQHAQTHPYTFACI